MLTEELNKDVTIGLKKIDIEIIKSLYSLKEDEEFTGTVNIVKSLMPGVSNEEAWYQAMLLNYRMKRLSPDIIHIEKKDGYYEYTLQGPNVKIFNHKFKNKKKRALSLKINNKEIIIEL